MAQPYRFGPASPRAAKPVGTPVGRNYGPASPRIIPGSRPAPPAGVSGQVGQPMPQVTSLPPIAPLSPAAPATLSSAPPNAAGERTMLGGRPNPTAWTASSPGGQVNGPGGYPAMSGGPPVTAPANVTVGPRTVPAPVGSGWQRGIAGLSQMMGGLTLGSQVKQEIDPYVNSVVQPLMGYAKSFSPQPQSDLRTLPLNPQTNMQQGPYQTLPDVRSQQPAGPTLQTLPQPMLAPPPAGPAYSPADNAINEAAAINQHLRSLPTMAQARAQSKATARRNYMQTAADINSGLMARNAGAMAGRADPLAAAGPRPALGSLPQPSASPAPMQPEPAPFATPRYGQTAAQAGGAYDAARQEGVNRTKFAVDDIMANRGDNMGRAQIARVGQNSTVIRTPDGKVNVVGNRQSNILSQAGQTGEFPEQMASKVRSQATPTGSIMSGGRSQSQKDARALRAQRLYSLPGSTPAVAAATQRAKVGGLPAAGLASITSGPQAAKELGKNAEKSDTWKFLEVNPGSSAPLEVQTRVYGAAADGQLSQENWNEIRADMKRRVLADPRMFDGGMLAPSTGRDARKKHWDDIIQSATPEEYLAKIGKSKKS